MHERDADGRTALHYAARNGHHNAVEKLKSASADLKMRDKKGLRPFELAKTKSMAMILWYGVDSGEKRARQHDALVRRWPAAIPLDRIGLARDDVERGRRGG